MEVYYTLQAKIVSITTVLFQLCDVTLHHRHTAAMQRRPWMEPPLNFLHFFRNGQPSYQCMYIWWSSLTQWLTYDKKRQGVVVASTCMEGQKGNEELVFGKHYCTWLLGTIRFHAYFTVDEKRATTTIYICTEEAEGEGQWMLKRQATHWRSSLRDYEEGLGAFRSEG